MKPEEFRPSGYGAMAVAGILACHWRFRLSFLLMHTLAISETEPRAHPSGHGVRSGLRPIQS